MEWADERYVRIYTRDTSTWKLLPWQGKCLLPLLLRKVDRAGVADVGDPPVEGVAALVDVPVEVVEPGLAALIKRGVVVVQGGVVVVPNYLSAQEARQSDRARQRECRERRRLQATGELVTNRDDLSQNVTNCHTRSHAVTRGHSESHAVTPSLAVPSLADPPSNEGGAAPLRLTSPKADRARKPKAPADPEAQAALQAFQDAAGVMLLGQTSPASWAAAWRAAGCPDGVLLGEYLQSQKDATKPNGAPAWWANGATLAQLTGRGAQSRALAALVQDAREHKPSRKSKSTGFEWIDEDAARDAKKASPAEQTAAINKMLDMLAGRSEGGDQ